jgi:peptidoglycan/xylan/chitin deacetylase (PgdA/CDA1 family)
VGWLTSGQVIVESLASLMRARVPGDRHRVAVTFDDGFANFASVAWPRLRDAGIPATVFLVSDHVGGTNRWRGEAVPGIPVLPLMPWETAARCAAEGVEIGAHSRTHPPLSTLPQAEAREEMAGSREVLASRLGAIPAVFAYPYGDVSPSVASEAAALFEMAVTTEYRPLRAGDSPYLVPRLDMFYFQHEGAFRDWGTPAFRGRLAVRRAARALRQRISAARIKRRRRAAEGL